MPNTINQDIADVKNIANKVCFTPSMTALDLIDELAILSTKEHVDGSLGLKVRSIIQEVHINLKH